MENICPAVPEWWNVDEMRQFYSIADPSYAPDRIMSPARFEKRQLVHGIEYAQFENGLWRRLPMLITWDHGPMAIPWPSAPLQVDHLHTTFLLYEHQIHVDFIRFFKGGPQTSWREYRIFADGNQIGRGGGSMGFIGGTFSSRRNWPLAARFDKCLIYFDRLLQDWTGTPPGQINTTDVLSVWELE